MGIVEVITVFAVIVANLGTVIALYIQQDKKTEEHRKETSEILRAIQLEIKDFHGRLCAIEERNKK
jgi:hypothetical protein